MNNVVLLDLDGTLIDSYESVLSAIEESLQSLFIQPICLYSNINRRESDSASAMEASPNAVLPDTSFRLHLNASINSFLLGRYFGEISIARIKKSTLLMSFYVIFYQLMFCLLNCMTILLKVVVPQHPYFR